MPTNPRGHWDRTTDPNNWHTRTLGWYPDNDREDAAFNPQPEIKVTTSIDSYGDPTIEIACGDDTIQITDIPAYFAEQRLAAIASMEEEPPVVERIFGLSNINSTIILELRKDGSLTWKGKV
jgi:hypothetical protein